MDKSRQVLRWVLWAFAAVLAALLLYRLRSLVFVLLLSAMLAYLLYRPLKYLERRMRRPWALLVIFGLLAGFLALFSSYAVPVFVRQAAELLGTIPRVMETLQGFLSRMAQRSGEPFGDFVNQSFDKLYARTTDWLGTATLGAAQSGYSNVGWVLLVPFITFYMLKDHGFFLDQLQYLVPVRWRADAGKLLGSIDLSLGHFLRGQLLVSIVVMAMMTVGLAVLGVPNYLLLGLLCGVFNMIPYVGPFLGAAPVALSAAVCGWQTLVLALILVLVVQQMDNMVLSPKIIGDNLRIHPLYIIVAILAGSGLLGFVGIVFALPLLIILRETVQFLFRRRLDARRSSSDIG